MSYARPSGSEVGKRYEKGRKNLYSAAEAEMTTELEHSSLGETLNEDESHTCSKDGSHPRRWSPEEDERLRNAVERHHEANWKEIAAEVGSRNHVQCLQRWKKVLTPGLVKGQWSREEDELLMSLVSEGHKNWGTLAARVPGRTSKQCRERWCHHLDPRIVKGDWTPEEDQLIVSMHEDIGNKWATIAQHLDGRTENATKIRWKILERSMKQEDEGQQSLDQVPRGNGGRQGTDGRLRCLAARAAASVMSKANDSTNPIGIPQNPAAVRDVLAQESLRDLDLPPQDLPQKRRSWEIEGKSSPRDVKREELSEIISKKRKLKPESFPSPLEQDDRRETNDREEKEKTELKERDGIGGGRSGRRGWLREEDERLRLGVEKLGDRNWRYVAQIVATRTHVQCQQRWKKALRPGLVKGAWSVEEDENLMRLISQGFSTWSELASHTPGRTAKQCRERWCHHLDPSVNHGSWTEEEDRQLLSLQARLGTKWSAIAREMPGRTEHAVKGRVKTLSRCQRVGAVGADAANRCKMPLKRREPLKPARTAVEAAEISTISSASLLDPIESCTRMGTSRPRSAESHASTLPMDPPYLHEDDSSQQDMSSQEDDDQYEQEPGTGMLQPGPKHPHQQALQNVSVEDCTRQPIPTYLSAFPSRTRDPRDNSFTSALESGGRVERSASVGITSGDSIAKLLSISSLGADSVAGMTEDPINAGYVGTIAACSKVNVSRETTPQISLLQVPFERIAMDSSLPTAQDGVSGLMNHQLEHQHQQAYRDSLQPLPSCQDSTRRTVPQMPVPSVGDITVLAPGVSTSSNVDVPTSSNVDLPTRSTVDISAPSNVGVSAPSNVGVPGPSNLGVSAPSNVGVHGPSNVGNPASSDVGFPPFSDVNSSAYQDDRTLSEASKFVNRPSDVDYSDLASFLIESFDAQHDGVGAGNERVSLGDDPYYSDYYDSGYGVVDMVQYPPGVRNPRGGKVVSPRLFEQLEQHKMPANGDDKDLGIWSESTEGLAPGVFDVSHPVCDPYF